MSKLIEVIYHVLVDETDYLQRCEINLNTSILEPEQKQILTSVLKKNLKCFYKCNNFECTLNQEEEEYFDVEILITSEVCLFSTG